MEFGNKHDTTQQTDFGAPTNHALAKYDVIVYSVEVGGANNRDVDLLLFLLLFFFVYVKKSN